VIDRNRNKRSVRGRAQLYCKFLTLAIFFAKLPRCMSVRVRVRLAADSTQLILWECVSGIFTTNSSEDEVRLFHNIKNFKNRAKIYLSFYLSLYLFIYNKILKNLARYKSENTKINCWTIKIIMYTVGKFVLNLTQQIQYFNIILKQFIGASYIIILINSIKLFSDLTKFLDTLIFMCIFSFLSYEIL